VSKCYFQLRNAIKIGLKIAQIVMSSNDGWMTVGLSVVGSTDNIQILSIARVFQVGY
jgi:hypothetical protein